MFRWQDYEETLKKEARLRLGGNFEDNVGAVA